jgi:hypothetical protein
MTNYLADVVGSSSRPLFVYIEADFIQGLLKKNETEASPIL